MFTGQEIDQKTGLIYFGARFYDPDSARFINQDGYLGEPGTPPSLHRYLYAFSNPTVYVDPDGHVAVNTDDIDSVLGAKNESNFALKSDALTDIAQDQNYDIKFHRGQAYLTPDDLYKLKTLVQTSIHHDANSDGLGSISNAYPAFVYISKEDTKKSLSADVRGLLGSGKYLENEGRRKYARALRKVLRGSTGTSISLSYERTEVMASIADAYENDNDNAVKSVLKGILNDVIKSGDPNLPDDIWTDAVTSTAWNFAPVPAAKGRWFGKAAASNRVTKPSLWESRPPGIQVRKFGDKWVKRVNPNASKLMQKWGEISIKSQAKALKNLGNDMAASHTLRKGRLFVEDVGETLPDGFRLFNEQARTAYLKGSRKIGPMNDIQPRNMGTNGKIFDPAIDPITKILTPLFFGGAYATGSYINEKIK